MNQEKSFTIFKECEQREMIVIDIVFSLCNNYMVACNNFGYINIWRLNDTLHPSKNSNTANNNTSNGKDDKQQHHHHHIFHGNHQQQSQQTAQQELILASFKPNISFLADSTNSPINKLFFYSNEVLLSSGDSDIMVWDWNRLKTMIEENDYNSGDGDPRVQYPHIIKDLKTILKGNFNSPRIEGIKGHLPERAEINGLDSDGKHLFFACGNNYAYSCDLTNLTIVNSFKGHQDYVLSIKYNSTFNQIITSSEDSTVRIWDPNTSNTLSILNPYYKISYDMTDQQQQQQQPTQMNGRHSSEEKLPIYSSTIKTKKSNNFNQWCGPLDLDETGNWLVVGGSTLSLWYLGRLNTMVANLPCDDCTHSVLFKQDKILSCGSEGFVNYYSPEGKLQLKVPSTSKILYSLAYNPSKSNQMLVAGGTSPLINVFINQENIAFSYHFVND